MTMASFTSSLPRRADRSCSRNSGVSASPKSSGVEHLPDFDFSAAVERRALHPLDRFIQRLGLDQPEAGRRDRSLR